MNRTASPPSSLRIERRLQASMQDVFDAWTRPHLLGRWLFTGPQSESHRVEVDLRVGGRYTIVDRRDGQDYMAVGVYEEIDAPRRLVFTFAMPQFSPDSDRITVELRPQGEGCLLSMTQEGVGITDELAQLKQGQESESASGWRRMFSTLAGVVARERGHGKVIAPGTVRFERLLPGPMETVWSYLADSDKRARWLAGGDMPARPGAEFKLRFAHGELSPEHAEVPARFRRYTPCVFGDHTVVRYEPPRFLAITWGGGGEPASLVEFALTPEGDKVRLVLTHRRLADAKEMANVGSGWHAHLAVLEYVLHGAVPPSFWTIYGDLEEAYLERMSSHSRA